jgi:NAD+ diphosphatase
VAFMMSKSIYERYAPELTHPSGDIGTSIVFVVNMSNLLVRIDGNSVIFPSLNDFNGDSLNSESTEYLGTIDNHHCYCLNFHENINIPEGMAFESLRVLMEMLETNMALVAGRAMHLANWSRLNKYCGLCGTITEKKNNERAKICPSCGNVIYPRISPAIIIAVVKDDKLLLAHNKNFKGKRYSVIAGFMEPGERFEDCAKREAMEEVGIKIKNIKYFGNQPWPFPDSLMIGLTAEYESGELKPDGVEIDDAGWYSRDNIPEIPGKVSIAGRLIEWFIQKSE